MRDKRIKIILSFVAILCAGTIIITGMSGENGQKEIADVQNPVV